MNLAVENFFFCVCVAMAWKIELGKTWINLWLTKSSLTPILPAVAINSSGKYDGLPVILVSPRSHAKNYGFVCSCIAKPAAFNSSLLVFMSNAGVMVKALDCGIEFELQSRYDVHSLSDKYLWERHEPLIPPPAMG